MFFAPFFLPLSVSTQTKQGNQRDDDQAKRGCINAASAATATTDHANRAAEARSETV